MKTLIQELQDRGLYFQGTDENALKKYDQGGEKFYCGFDPTADSLHLGNFIGFMVAVHLMRRGNTYVALTGGATGMIGDPGGKDSERSFLSPEILQNNQNAISTQMIGIIDNLRNYIGSDLQVDFVNNKDFYEGVGYLDFLREVGKFITINTMISKDTVKKRVEDPKKSISYTEFSYALLQGYDFCRLYEDSGVKMQIGGQDQWGNLVTGTELIRKKYDKKADVFTWPLITDASGKKFGKSEGNALWLDIEKTSAYELYQYFVNTADDDLSRYMKMLTLLETEKVDEIIQEHIKKPEERTGQRILARKIVEIIHGSQQADLAEKVTQFLFSDEDKLGTLTSLDNFELEVFQKSIGGFHYTDENLFESIVKAGLTSSNGEARNSVKSGAISINSQKISEFDFDFTSNFIGKKFILIQKGKKNFRLILN